MKDLKNGQVEYMQGSGAKPYELKNVGGVYSCSCPAWRNQSLPIERRTCKHLRKLRGDAAETKRIGSALTPIVKPKNGVIAPPLMLAQSWDRVLDPTGYWMSEKLDGVRALWNGKTREFITRKGNIYLAPAWFIEGLPGMDLDGELWVGRKMFQTTASIVRRQDQSDDWKRVQFLVFDAPKVIDVFENRVRAAQNAIKGVRFAAWHPHERVRNLKHLERQLSAIEMLGGEGLMLRAPMSKYDVGRTQTLLKVKNTLDAEAEVVGIQAGKGKHKGRAGALLVKLDDGTEFAIGTGLSDADREQPPAIGSTVKFQYQELTDGGVPRFPVYIGLREPA